MDEVEVYEAADGWRWRRRAAGNHEIIADSGEGYTHKSDCVEMAQRVNGAEVRYTGDQV